MSANLKRLLFFWTTSFGAATLGFYLLWLVMPRHEVFASWFRMLPYHNQHPVSYILLPCFFYGCIATVFANRFRRQGKAGQLFTTLLIALLTLLFSSPAGGMLWHFHDMQAGYFPSNWVRYLVVNGFSMGISTGWLIIGLSLPYSLFGIIVCFYLTRTGAALFRKPLKRKATA
jgi:hypothetical protein